MSFDKPENVIGRVVAIDAYGTQVIETNAARPDVKTVILGSGVPDYRAKGAQVGDFVTLEYRSSPNYSWGGWFAKVVKA